MNDIATVIPMGYANRVSREQLIIFTGLTDRKIRSLIEVSNEPIINVDNGYFIPDPNNPRDREYANVYYRREHARAMSILSKLKRYKGITNTMEGQMEFYER